MSIETAEGNPAPSDCPVPSLRHDTTGRSDLRGTVARLARTRWAAFALLAVVVLWYSGAWLYGDVVIDGHGAVLFVRLALRYASSGGGIPYWVPDMWAGTPVWAIGPSFPIFLLVPVAAVVGPVAAVKAAVLAFQVLGAWGAYVLARSLWDHRPAALVAGVAYGLSPVVITLAGLLGAETSMGVMAATPWIVWAFRRGLRGAGTRYLVGTGLLVGFAVLQQAEHAYGLALLGGCLLAAEVGRARVGLSTGSVSRLVTRALLVAVVGLGVVAHWLLPFFSLSRSFVLSPREMVQAELLGGLSGTVGREMGVFLNRSAGLHGVVMPQREGLVDHAFYLGVVPVVITFLTLLLLARRDDEGTLSAVLLASAVSVWLSTGAIALAEGGPAVRGQVVSFVLIGAVAGLAIGGFLRRLGVGVKGRAGLPVLVAVGVFLVALPYITPFVMLQRVVPLLSSIRFPRFYVVAALGLALGTAWPVVHLSELARSRRFRARRALPAALALAAIAAVVLDVWPYRTFYRLRAPAAEPAYVAALEKLDAEPTPVGTRVISSGVDPRAIDRLLVAGRELSTGWPHPLAGRQLWRVTTGAFAGPEPYAKDALGLSATTHVLREIPVDFASATESIAEVRVFSNEKVLAPVRAYDQVLLVEDRSITPDLAVALAHRNVAVVTPGDRPEGLLASLAVAPTIDGDPCRPVSADGLPAAIAGELATGCGSRTWIESLPSGGRRFGATLSPGATFTALTGGLHGVAVWLDALPGRTEMVIREVGPDDDATGRELARTQASSLDPYGMTVFAFDSLPESAGRHYSFTLECPDCFTETEPRMFTGLDIYRRGNLTVGGKADPERSAAFTPVYERLGAQPPSTTRTEIERRHAGRWRIRSTGTQPSLVVVAEANFPGWKARVDGRSVPVLEADGAFVGVVVGPGTHEIALDYTRPTAATIGRSITGATLLAVALGWLASRRRRPRHAFEVGAPPVDGRGKQPFEPREGEPSQAGSHRAGPGAEGDEPVLAVVDDDEAGGPDHREQ